MSPQDLTSHDPASPVLTFGDIVMKRHATKLFSDRKVSTELVGQLQDLIRHAATAFNVQPWRVVVVDEDAQKQALSEAAYGQPQITSCSHLFVFCANTDLETLVDRLEIRSTEAGLTVEQVDAYIGMVRGFTQGLTGDDRLSWAQRQTYLALGNGTNGAKSLGFDSCPMEGFDSGRFAETLGLPDTLVPTALMPIGYAVSEPRPKLRFSREDMFFAAT